MKASKIYYREYNKEEITPVVLIHGAGGSYLSWPPEMRRIEGFHTYALDLPGHGQSEDMHHRSIQEQACAVLEWLEKVGLTKTVIEGHSMGGAVALWLAHNHPDHVEKLVLLGSAGKMRVNLKLLELAKREDTSNQAVDLIIRWSFSKEADSRLVDLVKKRMLASRSSVLYADLLACDDFDFSEQIKRVTQPTLILCGSEDKMTPLEGAKWMAERMPSARLEVIPGAGHMLMLEKPQAAAEATQRFLKAAC